jgi:hypothetical protein
MIQRALNSGVDASYVLMDTWFTHQPLIKNIKELGIDVIGMVKKLKQRYLVEGERVSLNELYRLAAPIQGKKGLLRSIITTQANGVPVKVVFVRNRNKRSEIVFARYIVLSWQNRCSTDQRTLGGMFYELCDEISELDWAIALQQLIDLLEDTLKKSNKKIQKLIQSQLEQWIANLPNYIKAYLPISVCES